MTEKDWVLVTIQALGADATYDDALDKLETLQQGRRLESQKGRKVLKADIPPTFKDAATPKERMLFSLNRMPDNADLDRAIYTVQLIQGIAEALEESERGEGMDHDEFFAELLNEDAQQKNQVVGARPKRPKSSAAVHRSTRKAKDRSRFRPAS